MSKASDLAFLLQHRKFVISKDTTGFTPNEIAYITNDGNLELSLTSVPAADVPAFVGWINEMFGEK